jgi:hypothetical protein
MNVHKRMPTSVRYSIPVPLVLLVNICVHSISRFWLNASHSRLCYCMILIVFQTPLSWNVLLFRVQTENGKVLHADPEPLALKLQIYNFPTTANGEPGITKAGLADSSFCISIFTVHYIAMLCTVITSFVLKNEVWKIKCMADIDKEGFRYSSQ